MKIKENNFILKKETTLVFEKGLEETAIISPENLKNFGMICQKNFC